MARIALMAVDSEYPNLALMKVSAWHKAQGDVVEWYNPFDHYDVLYQSKIFAFTPDWQQYITNADEVHKGGTGYDFRVELPKEIDCLQPDYSIYPNIDSKTSYGFLTRGCPNKCKWCVVPLKEGAVHPYCDIEEVIQGGRTNAILMDNNILASEYGLQQIEKIIKLGVRVDFNQAMDARLVTDDIAKLLARVKWIKYMRFGCDTHAQIKDVQRAIALIDKHSKKQRYYHLYCMLHGSIEECYERVSTFRENSHTMPFSQPFRDPTNPHHKPPMWQQDMARWVNRRQLFMTMDFKDYKPRQDFVCKQYFNQ